MLNIRRGTAAEKAAGSHLNVVEKDAKRTGTAKKNQREGATTSRTHTSKILRTLKSVFATTGESD